MEREKKIADCLLLGLQKGFEHIGHDELAEGLTLEENEDGSFDIRDMDDTFAVRVSSNGIGIQIYTIASKERSIHIQRTIKVDEDVISQIDEIAAIDLDDVPECIYEAVAFLLGEWVKYGIQEIGWELLFVGSKVSEKKT